VTSEYIVQKSAKDSISFDPTKAPFVNEMNTGGGCSRMQTLPTEGIKGGVLIDIDPEVIRKQPIL